MSLSLKKVAKLKCKIYMDIHSLLPPPNVLAARRRRERNEPQKHHSLCISQNTAHNHLHHHWSEPKTIVKIKDDDFRTLSQAL